MNKNETSYARPVEYVDKYTTFIRECWSPGIILHAVEFLKIHHNSEHSPAHIKSFVLRSYAMHESRNKNISIDKFLATE